MTELLPLKVYLFSIKRNSLSWLKVWFMCSLYNIVIIVIIISCSADKKLSLL